MQVILLMGIPASGKSTFFKQSFADTHIRINRDMLKTRNRERRLYEFCLTTEQPCVIDNTNVSISDRREFIEPACHKNFPVTGYFFQSRKAECFERNRKRKGTAKVPDVAIYAKVNELEIPVLEEGFTKLYFVKIVNGRFEVSPWNLDL